MQEAEPRQRGCRSSETVTCRPRSQGSGLQWERLHWGRGMKGPKPSEVTGRPTVRSGLRTQSALWPSVAGPNALCLSFLNNVSITIVLTW